MDTANSKPTRRDVGNATTITVKEKQRSRTGECDGSETPWKTPTDKTHCAGCRTCRSRKVGTHSILPVMGIVDLCTNRGRSNATRDLEAARTVKG